MKTNSKNTFTAEEYEYIKSPYGTYSNQLKDPNVYKKTLKTSSLESFGNVITTGGLSAYGQGGSRVSSGSWISTIDNYEFDEVSLAARIEVSRKQIDMIKDKLILAEAHLKLLLDEASVIPVKHNRKKLNIIKKR